MWRALEILSIEPIEDRNKSIVLYAITNDVETRAIQLFYEIIPSPEQIQIEIEAYLAALNTQ